MSADLLSSPIEFLKGVGEAKAAMLRKDLGITVFRDLLLFFPYRYVDRTRFTPVGQLLPDSGYAQIKGVFEDLQLQGSGRGMRLKAMLRDGSGHLEVVWFQGFQWVKDKIEAGREYVLFGRIGVFNNKFSMAHPELIAYDDFLAQPFAGRLQPMYSSTEKLRARGLDSRGISKLVRTLLEKCSGLIPETLPDYIRTPLKIPAAPVAFANIHFPPDDEALAAAERRFRFEEAFFMQLQHAMVKSLRNRTEHGFVFDKVGDFFNAFYQNKLPFELTLAQKRVMKEIRADLGSGTQMNRLLQGDVGSGKTMVALMCLLLAIDNGYQAALMVPTEILAAQHYKTICHLLDGIGLKVELLTGSTIKGKRKLIHPGLLDGSVNLVIGTHALIEDAVQFKKLGLIVIDEQHRFGVEQRARLRAKASRPPHVLVMTATPIPRTLAMTAYGDLDVSIIDELPPGRKAVKTIALTENQRLRVQKLMRQEIESGHQIYVVYPLINESEKLDLLALEQGHEAICRDFPMPKYEVSMIHGKLKPADKEFGMDRFIRGLSNILVSTTVIEVGVDVPNASVMIIENAERFGLSQLHQLRGRVGRGADQSWCILLCANQLSSEAKARIQAMVSSSDGFVIAEKDLEIRGPGDIQGTRQSGDEALKLLDLVRDEKLITYCRNLAKSIIEKDAELDDAENKLLQIELFRLRAAGSFFSQIG